MKNAVPGDRTTNWVFLLMEKYPYGVSRRKILAEGRLNGLNLRRAWDNLRKEGRIVSLGYALFGLNKNFVTGKKLRKGTLLSGDPGKAYPLNVHAVQISFPIMEDNTDPRFWDTINKEFKNSVVKWKRVQRPIGLTIQANSKTLSVQIWGRDIDKPEDVESLMLRAAVFVHSYLKDHGMTVDLFSVEKKNVEIAVGDETPGKIVGTKDVVKVDLGRAAGKIFEKDKDQKAEAYACPTPWPSVETNDLKYMENYLRSPERVAEIIKTQAEFAENLKLHLDVLRKLGDAVDRLADKVDNHGKTKL